jgi:hypothetical protein
MTWMRQLSEEHQLLQEKWEKRKDKLDEQRKEIRKEQEDITKEYEAKHKALDKKMSSHWDKHLHHTETILKPIAEKIAKKLNLGYGISGPYGLNNHYYLSFLDKNKKTVHILYLRPTQKNDKRWYGIVTSKIIDKTIPPNSIAGMNDNHKEVIPLPETIPQIIKMMKSKKEARN